MVLVAFLTHKKTVVHYFQRRCFDFGLPKSFYIWDPKPEQITLDNRGTSRTGKKTVAECVKTEEKENKTGEQLSLVMSMLQKSSTSLSNRGLLKPERATPVSSL